MSLPPLRKRVKRAVRTWLLRGLLAIVKLLPLGAALALGRAGGGLAYGVFAKDRRLALEHLAKAFPEKTPEEQEAIARAMFRSLGETGMEIAQIDKLDRRLESYVEIEPSAVAALDQARKGSGVVAVTGHIGNWELLFRRIVRSGRPAYAVGAELSHGGLTAIVEELRGPGRTIWRGAPGASKKLLRAFREDAYLALLIDQDTKVQGVFVPFFGELAHTPRAAADLALRTGAGIVTIFIHRKAGGGHRISGRQVEYTPTGDPEADALAITAEMTRAIEEEVRRVPHEWVWMHRRWQTRPPDERALGS
ncbi:lysophospholipid acyltransferase family protein [Vulgatibacter incomptus]|uniref:lysophospholipid acyltransferase family protein n=1 Tax=Vulgatibacter incomptus TaxID=1391653 RepID=UPI000683041C|nr:hypothetical protein [Vulgatibacter incomptus]